MKSKISPSALPKADSRASFVIGCGILLTTAATYLIVLQLSSQKAVSLANASLQTLALSPNGRQHRLPLGSGRCWRLSWDQRTAAAILKRQVGVHE
jgi:hypothetical protein